MQKGIPLPNRLGVQDPLFRMPGPVEFPKMAYKKDASHPQGYITKVVNSQEEQDALTKGWLWAIKDVHALLESLMGRAEEVEEVQEEKSEKKLAKVAK